MTNICDFYFDSSDDEDSDAMVVSCSLKERKREANTQAEQMRRDAIKVVDGWWDG